VARPRRTLISLVGLGFLLTILFAATAVPAFAASGNLIPNGSNATGTVEGTIVPVNNVQDTWGVYMWAGETVRVDVDSAVVQLQMYAPGAYPLGGTVVGDLLATHIAGSPTALTCTASATGLYTLRVTSVDVDPADYEVAASFDKVMTYMAINMPVSVTTNFGGNASFSGQVYNPRGIYTDPPAGLLTVSWSSDGRVFWPYETTATLPGGMFSLNLARATFEKTWWNVVFAGDEEFGPSSGTFVISPYAQLDVLTATRTKKLTYRIGGRMRPFVTAGTYPVRVYIERKVSGKWKAYGYLKAKASDGPYQDYSFLTVTKTFPYAGSWRMRPYYAGTAAVLKTWGSWTSFTVK